MTVFELCFLIGEHFLFMLNFPLFTNTALLGTVQVSPCTAARYVAILFSSCKTRTLSATQSTKLSNTYTHNPFVSSQFIGIKSLSAPLTNCIFYLLKRSSTPLTRQLFPYNRPGLLSQHKTLT